MFFQCPHLVALLSSADDKRSAELDSSEMVNFMLFKCMKVEKLQSTKIDPNLQKHFLIRLNNLIL